MSKIETGAQFPTDEDVSAWLQAAGALDEQDVLAELLTRARVESVSFRHSYRGQGGVGAYQSAYREQEQQATRVATYTPTMMPGLLQTAAYARDVVFLPVSPTQMGHSTPEEGERMVAVRIERQAVLYEPGKALHFVIGEAALWTRMGSIEGHLGQLDRLQSIIGLRTIDVRIFPFSSVTPLAPPVGFSIFDSEFVIVETPTEEHFLRDPEEVRSYDLIFEHLQAGSVAGEEAAELVRGVARQLSRSVEP